MRVRDQYDPPVVDPRLRRRECALRALGRRRVRGQPGDVGQPLEVDAVDDGRADEWMRKARYPAAAWFVGRECARTRMEEAAAPGDRARNNRVALGMRRVDACLPGGVPL